MIVRVYVSLKPSVLDPQGKAVQRGLASMGYNEVSDVRIGKYIELTLEEGLSPEAAKERVDEMCKKLLANTIIENYRIELT